MSCIVSINHFIQDTNVEIKLLMDKALALDGKPVLAKHWTDSWAGTEELARAVVDIVDNHPGQHRYVYDDSISIWDKIKTITTKIYGTKEIIVNIKIRNQVYILDEYYGHFSVCIAKTKMSFSADPKLKGAPSEHSVEISEVCIANGAGFIVVIAGNIMTMPGLPKLPAAEDINIDERNNISRLF